MSKYYYGFFRDTDNSIDPEGRLFKVVIKTKKGNGVSELLFSGSPFTVTYDSDDIFKSYKCSTATIGLQNRDYNDDFVCESIMDNEVFLYKLKEGEAYRDDLISSSADNVFFDLQWCGYTSPNVYHQGYNSYYDTFELECQDKLSILKYYRWDDIRHFNIGSQTNLYNVLNDVCEFLGVSELNVTKSLRIPNASIVDDDMYSWMLRIYFLTSSFYDDGQGRYISEILDDIMSYVSLTMVQVVNNIYVVNYNAIATGFNDYESVNFIKHSVGTKQIGKDYEVIKEDSASNDTNLSVLESFDDFAINTETNEIDRSMPSVEWYNKTPSRYVDEQYSWCYGRIFKNNDQSTLTKFAEWDGYSVYQQVTGHTVWGYTSIQFYSHKPSTNYYTPDIKYYGYSADESVTKDGFVIGDEIQNYEPGQCLLCDNTYTIRYRVSAMPCSYALLNNEDWWHQLDKEHEDGILICHPVSNAEYMTDDQWYNLIQSWILINQQPMVDITYKNVSITQEHPLCWRGEVQFFPDYIPCSFEPTSKVERAYDRWEMSIILKTSNQTLYYDDVNRRWTTALTIMHPSLGVEYDQEMYGIKRKFGNNRVNDFNVKKYDDGVVISGFGNDYLGDLTIRLFRPYGPDATFAKITSSTLLTNIDLVQLDTRDSESDIDSNDTTYAYKDPTKYINEQNEETLKYTSSPKQPNVENIVYTRDENDQEFVILDYILDIPSGDVFRPEEHRLRDKTKQFLTPQIQLEVPTHADVDMLTKVEYHRFRGKAFVVDGMETDYATNKKTIKLIEKK